MSTANIVTITGNSREAFALFDCHGGGQRWYRFVDDDAVALLSGSDPAGLDGERVAGPAGGTDIGGGIGDEIGEAADVAVDIAEIGIL